MTAPVSTTRRIWEVSEGRLVSACHAECLEGPFPTLDLRMEVSCVRARSLLSWIGLSWPSLLIEVLLGAPIMEEDGHLVLTVVRGAEMIGPLIVRASPANGGATMITIADRAHAKAIVALASEGKDFWLELLALDGQPGVKIPFANPPGFGDQLSALLESADEDPS